MELKDIISIGGRPGLFKVAAKRKNELIVESIPDGKKIFIYALDKVSALEDISIYTDTEDIPLVDIYDKLFEIEKGNKSIDHKSDPKKLKEKMIEILPDYDQDRVYNSDIKKLILWYNMLIEAGLLVKSEKEESAKEESQSEE
ncbi:MAG: hypothetical protein DRI54_00805 [Bacteroidetes bacterium]|nr:MAG: hypothetical protein DRI54_00805 [Bacteroidota bacterium]